MKNEDIFFCGITADQVERSEESLFFVQKIDFQKENQNDDNQNDNTQPKMQDFLELTSIGFGKVIDENRKNLQRINELKTKKQNKVNNFYYDILENRLLQNINQFIEILKQYKLYFEQNKQTSALVQTLKSLADNCRYKCEIEKLNNVQNKVFDEKQFLKNINEAKRYYEQALSQEIDQKNTIYLTTFMNYCLFQYEYLNQKHEAYEKLNKKFEQHISLIKNFELEEEKDQLIVLSTMEDNLEDWKKELKMKSQLILKNFIMSKIQDLLCNIHKKKTEYICEIPNCSQRYLCNECLDSEHYHQHQYNISNLREFIYEQNKTRPEILESYQGRLMDIKSQLEKHKNEVSKDIQQIDYDFMELGKLFQSISQTASTFLKQNITKDYENIIQMYEKEKSKFRDLKIQMDKLNPRNDFIINFQKQSYQQGIEQLIQKNSFINQNISSIRHFQSFVDQCNKNRIVYNINENTKAIKHELKNIFHQTCVSLFRKFKILLVRPSLEQELNRKSDMIINKLRSDYQPQSNRKNQEESMQQSMNMTNSSVFYNMSKDIKIMQDQKFQLPQHVLMLDQNFGTFQSPQNINHPNFVNLIQKESCVLEDGSIYEGQWDKDGVRQGRGRCIFNDKIFYDGYWIDGEPNILGRFVYPDCSLCEGLVKNGLPNGKCIVTDLNGYKYVGFFTHGKKHGNGTEEYPNGMKYNGMFFEDNYQGKGQLILPNGGKYEGDFFMGKFDGKGILQYPNNETYEGEWSENKMHGKGIYKYKDGRIYEGDFINDKPHGFGKLKLQDGQEYNCFWKMGVPHGIAVQEGLDVQSAKSIIVNESDILNDPNMSLLEQLIQSLNLILNSNLNNMKKLIFFIFIVKALNMQLLSIEKHHHNRRLYPIHHHDENGKKMTFQEWIKKAIEKKHKENEHKDNSIRETGLKKSNGLKEAHHHSHNEQNNHNNKKALKKNDQQKSWGWFKKQKKTGNHPSQHNDNKHHLRLLSSRNEEEIQEDQQPEEQEVEEPEQPQETQEHEEHHHHNQNAEHEGHHHQNIEHEGHHHNQNAEHEGHDHNQNAEHEGHHHDLNMEHEGHHGLNMKHEDMNVPYHHQQDNKNKVSVQSKKSSNKSKVNAEAKSFSKGNGESMASAGPKGSHSAAKGTEGSGSMTNFQAMNDGWEDSWGFASDGSGNTKQYGKKHSLKQAVNASGKGGSQGNGQTQSQATLEGSMTRATGDKGSFAGSNFENHSQGWGDFWTQEKKSNGEHKTHRNRFEKKDNSQTKSEGAALGKGEVNSKSDNLGGMVHAQGENGSKGNTAHKGQSHMISDEFTFGFEGGKKHNSRTQKKRDEHSAGHTNSEAMGSGFIQGMSHRYEGSKTKSQGTGGTKNAAGWSGEDNKQEHSFNFDEWY